MAKMVPPERQDDQYDQQIHAAIKAVHYAFPALCFLYFGISLTVTVCTLQTQSLRIRDQHVRRNLILALILAVAGTYFIEAVTLGVHDIYNTKEKVVDHLDDGRLLYLISSTVVFVLEAIALVDAKFPVWYPYYGTWFLGFMVELGLLVAPNYHHGRPTTLLEYVFIVIPAIRTLIFLILPTVYFRLRNDEKEYDNSDAERQALLSKKLSARVDSGYGSTTSQEADSDNASDTTEDSYLAEQRKAQDKIAKRLKQDGNWFTYAKGFAIFFPYIWPVNSKRLQFRAVLVGICLLGSNALNVLVPRQLGKMIDSVSAYLAEPDGPKPWISVLLYAVLLFIAGGACIGWIRKWLWLPVEQYSYDALSTASHAHLMSLSSDFHDSKSSADLTQAVNGGRSVTYLLETVCFQVIPMFIDLVVAFAYLSFIFGPYMGIILLVEAIAYFYTTTKLVALKAEKRREYVTIYRKEWTVGQQSLDGWNTASLFNQIPYERHRYACAVKEHMKAKRDYELSSQTINAAQGAVMALGLLGALYLGVNTVVGSKGDPTKTVGLLTQLLVYWGQLQSPLSFFSNMYRTISYSLMDAERLLELFQTKPTITDRSDAKPLKLSKGKVEFNNVSFAYDERKPTLKNVSFVVPSGKTIALVGETGGGKTTILKLIDRFYDVKSGNISIDGQDIRDITLDSLRSHIGVVPQDPLMFNDSIMNNIRYARLTASDNEVYESCKAAAIHDKIMSFPDGYNSKVGDRGVKLSGGEKQRVAIARAMLKAPEIILLDEATSSVDTETESRIQEGFKKLCEERTTFIVAHRLSTVMRADCILVVMNGEIVEQGSHYDLIHDKGKYHDLWSKQIFVVPDTKRARSKSPVKRDVDLINDLTPGRRTVELSRALKTTAHVETEGGCSTDTEGEGSKFQVEDNAAGNHKREGSKLKADAPEFVPLRVQFEPSIIPPKDGQATTKEDRKAEKIAAKWLKADQKAERKAEKSTAKAAKRAGDAPAQLDGPSEAPSAEGDATSEPKLRRTRSARRHNAKSEPANRNQGQSSTDGAHDSEMSGPGFGEGQPLAPASSIQPRRVSAPSDPPTGQQDSRGNGRKRTRHWRLKNRTAVKNVGSSSSGATSSGGGSTEDHALAPTPNTTPAEGLPRIDDTSSLARGS